MLLSVHKFYFTLSCLLVYSKHCLWLPLSSSTFCYCGAAFLIIYYAHILFQWFLRFSDQLLVNLKPCIYVFFWFLVIRPASNNPGSCVLTLPYSCNLITAVYWSSVYLIQIFLCVMSLPAKVIKAQVQYTVKFLLNCPYFSIFPVRIGGKPRKQNRAMALLRKGLEMVCRRGAKDK